MKRFNYIKAFNSPFKRPKLKWYFGKIAIGTPYFYPRKWVKATPKLAMEAALREIEDTKRFNELNEKNGYQKKVKSLDELVADKMKYRFPIPKKIGFDFVPLGFKTKWTNTDYRFEWSPLVSFVFFKWQIAIMVIPEKQDHYWEAWLFYENNTDKTKSPRERIEQCKEEFPLTYISSNGKEKKTINYYDVILKDKYK